MLNFKLNREPFLEGVVDDVLGEEVWSEVRSSGALVDPAFIDVTKNPRCNGGVAGIAFGWRQGKCITAQQIGC